MRSIRNRPAPARRAGALALCAALGAATLAGCASASGQYIDQSIGEFDFANAEIEHPSGETFQLEDGFYAVPDQPDDVGYHLREGPEFADVDGDGDLDAATVMEWVPAAGSVVSEAFVWLWDGETARQVTFPISAGYDGAVSELRADDDVFSLHMQAPDGSRHQEPSERVSLAVEDGFPLQTEPVRGAANRCGDLPGAPEGDKVDGETPRVAPDQDAPAIGDPEEFDSIVTVDADANTADWNMVRAERDGEPASCGWLPTSQGSD